LRWSKQSQENESYILNVFSNERVSTQQVSDECEVNVVSHECGLERTSRKPTGLKWCGLNYLHTDSLCCV